MKLPISIILLLTATLNVHSQKIGLNLNTPIHPLHIVQPEGTTLGSQQPLIYGEYTGTNIADVIGIKVKAKPADYYGIGGDFEGGYVGVQGRITGGLDQAYFGVKADVAGSGFGDFFGIHGNAHGSGDNYGVYGKATGGLKNWAGYFESGNVFIKNRLGIGNDNPLYPVHINQPVGTTISHLNPVMYVEYTGNNNADVIAIRGKCVIGTFRGIGGEFEGAHAGVIGKVNATDNNSHFGVQGIVTSTNASGINTALYGKATGGSVNYGAFIEDGDAVILDDLGVGGVPATNKLEVFGNASKSTAGDWLANSDARLKKNIQPLDEKEMIEKLLALKGVTYEWNDDKTGSVRPEGVHYGFTAQNIQEVFPTLVSEDANGYLQTAYGTYDAMMIEAIRALYQEWKAQEQKTLHMQQQLDEQALLYVQLLSEIENLKAVNRQP